MNLTALLVGFGAGLIIGAAYLLGLWLTVRRVARTGDRRLLIVSFVARAAVFLLALYGLIGLGPAGLLAALLGFITARWLFTRLVGRGGGPGPAGPGTSSGSAANGEVDDDPLP